MASQPATTDKQRIDWVDIGKGICIVLVVMMHSTLGVERVLGETTWFNGFIAWAKPFRMPDFFLISGLFLAARIDRPWRDYLDTKVVHFAYFYILWMTILYVLKGALNPGDISVSGYVLGFIDPPGSLWFIYMLAVFFVVVKLTRGLPWWSVLGAGVLLHSLPVHTGWTLLDEFAARFVYFYAGYLFAPLVFRFADLVARTNGATLFNGFVLWAAVNGWAVSGGFAALPGISLVLGVAGAAAVVAFAVVLGRINWGALLGYCGRNSIVIYLAYAVFMAPVRTVALRLSDMCCGNLVVLAVTTLAIAGPLVLHMVVRGTALDFLFRRPDALRLGRRREKPENTRPLHCL